MRGASDAFIHAMNSGFWVSAAVLASGVAIAAWLLPDRARTVQVERDADANEAVALSATMLEIDDDRLPVPIA
jgi:hypothetical protein